jgi:hypothetical protein
LSNFLPRCLGKTGLQFKFKGSYSRPKTNYEDDYIGHDFFPECGVLARRRLPVNNK